MNLPGATVQPKLLSVFVPGKPVNQKNEHKHWRVRQQRVKAQKEAVHAVILAELRRAGMKIEAPPAQPKIVTFVVTVERRFDEGDNLPVVCSAYRDALKGILIHADGIGCSHTFVYRQQLAIPGTGTGVEITVELDPRAIGDPRWNRK